MSREVFNAPMETAVFFVDEDSLDALAHEAWTAVGREGLEHEYETVFCQLLKLENASFIRQADLKRTVIVRGKALVILGGRMDLVIEGWPVELKVSEKASNEHVTQLRRYLRYGGYDQGYLIIFTPYGTSVQIINANLLSVIER